MSDIFRDSLVGRCVRKATGRRLCRYPEDHVDFQLPPPHTSKEHRDESASESSSIAAPAEIPPVVATSPARSDVETVPVVEEESKEGAVPIAAGYTVVDWYSTVDPENPLNWGSFKKAWVTLLLLAYVVAVYIGSSLYTASTAEVIQIFHVGDVTAALGLALYVIGYGTGSLLWSPLSEIPAVGRNPPYALTFLIFVILCVPAAVVDDFAGILVLRFLLGFFGSPALSTAAASLGDIFDPKILPYMILSWTGGAVFAPALGPLVGGFAVQAKGWRWSFWELLWASGPMLVVMLLVFPETSADAILCRRAKRLRDRTRCTDIMCLAEVKRAQMSASQIAFDALIKPWEINILDPAVLFTTLYTALIYAVYYTFFESFPLVYQGVYGFDLGELGLAFLSVLVGVAIAVLCFISYQYFYAGPKQAKVDAIAPEEQLRPGLVATFFIPVGLFMFAWTSRASIYWIVSTIGIVIGMGGMWSIATCMLGYLPYTHPRYAGSLFAANNLARSLTAAGAILYARPMFDRLGISGGVSLLAGLMVICSVGLYVLFFFGPRLRQRGRFTGL